MSSVFVNDRDQPGTYDKISQDYQPYRKAILGVPELQKLTTLRSGIVVRDTLWLWAQIILSWMIVDRWPLWWVILVCIPVIGTRFYALFIIGHDGLHRRLFKKRWVNDLWNDLFVLAPIFSITRMNRWNHMQHHSKLALPSDPDRYKYISTNKPSRFSVLLVITGIAYVVKAVKNVLIPNIQGPEGKSVPLKYSSRDLLILGICQLMLIGGLSITIGWWAYLVLWIIPVYVFTYTADIVRVFLEHSMLTDDVTADKSKRLVTYVSTPFERVFFAPMNMNFHSAHHLWPSIPYYNLPKADKYMRDWQKEGTGLYWRSSYIGYLFEYIRLLPWFGNRFSNSVM